MKLALMGTLLQGTLFILGVLASCIVTPAELLQVIVNRSQGGLSLQSSAPVVASEGAVEIRLEQSSDLKSWSLSKRSILSKGHNAPWTLEVPAERAHRFFRIRSNTEVQLIRATSEEALGYTDVFDDELAKLGEISPEEFAELYPDRDTYIKELSWDPATADYFAEFNSEPGPLPPIPGFQQVQPRDFRLNANELALFKKNGFVVTERITHTNFADLYYDVFVRDLPVFVTADSMLHAWSRSYEAMLEQLEDAYLSHALGEVFDAMSAQLPGLMEELTNTPFQNATIDADYFLTVARSLLAGTEKPVAGWPDWFTNDHRVQVRETLAAIERGEPGDLNFPFSMRREHTDYSQFKVRGYYEKSLNLQRYFQAMMWCSLIDFRLILNESYNVQDISIALVLNELLIRSGKLDTWSNLDAAITTFVGPKDSMDFRQIQQIAQVTKLKPLREIKSFGELDQLFQAIDDGEYGVQEVMGHWYYSPLGPEQVWLPRSFTFLGQRFTMDAWALGKVVFDRIKWSGGGPGVIETKVVRRRASALDVAFSAFQNDLVTPEIVSRIQTESGLPFRDGLPYQHNLAAARRTIDLQTESAWRSSIYGEWLGALRTLSGDTTDQRYPESMRTRAWALRRLNTQLASWTQLRHATVLYAKQTTLPFYLCSYPAGFVEPIPQFWAAIAQMARNTKELIEILPMSGTVLWQARIESVGSWIGQVDLALMKAGQISFLQRFETNMTLLASLAEKELAQEPFSPEEETHLLDLVEVRKDYVGTKTYSGWYPKLYYASNEGTDMVTVQANLANQVSVIEHASSQNASGIVDVMTAPPDTLVGDPGAVLHEAVGDVNFMLVAVDNGPDRMVFGGPVFSHYEMNVEGVERLTDSDWEARIHSESPPPPPEWTRSWLAPRVP